MRFCLILLFALPLAAQTAKFEVASVRPSKEPDRGTLCYGFKTGTENIRETGITFNLLIIAAYEGQVDRFDLPEWGRNAKFEVTAKLPPNSNADSCREMLRNLLAERFHFVPEIKAIDMPTYFLRVAKSGFKLKPAAGPPPEGSLGGSSKTENGRTRWTFQNAPMSRVFTPVQGAIALGKMNNVFASDLLVDETGLTGYYNGVLELPSYLKSANPDGLFPDAAALNDALIEQAGLTIELRKAPAKFLSIRSSDRMPTEN